MFLVYTGIFGNRDNLKDPVVDRGVRYVCFTDDKTLTSKVWEIIHIDCRDTPQVMTKRCKILSHEFLAAHNISFTESLWLDASFHLHGLRHVRRFLNERNVLVGLLKHPTRQCAYHEANWCLRHRRDKAQRIAKTVDMLKKSGFPERKGLYCGGVLLRRSDDATATFERGWFDAVMHGTIRDQVSLPYVLWSTGVPFDVIPRGTLALRWHRHRR